MYLKLFGVLLGISGGSPLGSLGGLMGLSSGLIAPLSLPFIFETGFAPAATATLYSTFLKPPPSHVEPFLLNCDSIFGPVFVGGHFGSQIGSKLVPKNIIVRSIF